MKVTNSFCVECSNRVASFHSKYLGLDSDDWINLCVYLKRYPTSDELDFYRLSAVIGIPKWSHLEECGCSRPSTLLDLVQDKLMVDVTHTFTTTSKTGIQNFVHGLLEGLNQLKVEHYLVRSNMFGYSRIEEVDPKSTISFISKFFHLVLEKIAKSFLILRVYTFFKPIISKKIVFKIKNFIFYFDQTKNLLLFSNCKILLPESILDFEKVDQIAALYKSSNKIIYFLHDAFPITHPELVSEETRARSGAIMRLLMNSHMVSCQTKAVAEVAKGLLTTRSLLESQNSQHFIQTHERPIYLKPSDPPIIPDTTKLNSINKLIQEKYVLAVGTIEPRKDYTTLVLACEKLWNRNLDFSLIIAGNKGWGEGNFRLLVRHLIRSGRPIRVVNSLSDSEILALTLNSTSYVYCSVSEGLGLPPGEAIVAGKTPICRKLPSLIEQYGTDRIHYYDGTVEGLASSIEMNLLKSNQIKKLSEPEFQDWKIYAKSILESIDVL